MQEPRCENRSGDSENLISESLVRAFASPFHSLQVNAFFRHFIKRRKFPQPQNHVNELVRYVVHFRLSVEASNAETNRTVCQVVARTQTLEYVGRFQSCRRTSRTAGDGNVVNAHQQRL